MRDNYIFYGSMITVLGVIVGFSLIWSTKVRDNYIFYGSIITLFGVIVGFMLLHLGYLK